MDIASNVTAVVLLLGANGFFVAAEFASVKARGFRVEATAREGSAAARLTLRIQANLEAYLAACQLGITMASLGLGWVGEPAVAALLEPLFHWLGIPAPVLHTSAFIVGFLLFSSLHIVVGEQVPKTLAIRKAEPVALWVAYPLRLFYLAAWPLNWLLTKATSIILALFKVEETTHAEVLSGEEIKNLVETSRDHGEIEADQADMLHNLFDFDQRHLGRVMIPRSAVDTLDLCATPDETLHVIRQTEHSGFPVIDSSRDDAIVGVLLARDIQRALLNGGVEPWRDLQRLCREPLVVPESQRVPQLFRLMREKHAHMAFVIDEYGVLAGIVTLEDLLEEIVGEIRDETDDAEPSSAVQVAGNGSWEADGLVSLCDLEQATGLSIPPGLDANTISGLFMQRLARIPEMGDAIEMEGYRLRVLSVADRRVGRAAVERLDEPAEATQPAHRDSLPSATDDI